MSQLDQLTGWCDAFLPRQVQRFESLELTSVSGDAGFRSYYRLNTQPTLIAVDAPVQHEDVPGFVEKALFFASHSIHVPEIFAVDYSRGFMLIEDLGDELLLLQLNDDSADALYATAEQLLSNIQQLPLDRDIFQQYSAEKLQQEMALFPEWFVNQLLGVSLTDDEKQLLASTFKLLVEEALSQPSVIVHRDYHSRNLLLGANNQLAVIDFQDAVIGPISYDLVSLLKDCYIRWPADLVYGRVEQYYNRCCATKMLANVELATFIQWFDLMGLQRHLKVLGIFARLSLRDGKPHYLHDLPLVLRYTLECTAANERLQPFHQWFIERLLPIIESQPWYTPWQTAGDKQ